MDLFYTQDWDQTQATLTGDEAKHCSRVFRHGPGEAILLTDGKGYLIEGVIDEVQKNRVLCRVQKTEFVGSGRNYQLSLVIAPTKNINRIEWLVEKSIEVGIDHIQFVECFHSERKKVRMDRLERIALAAMKQSQQFILPEIAGIQPLSGVLQSRNYENSRKFTAHLSEKSRSIKELMQPSEHYAILIGPEGDFSEDEISLAQQYDWQLCTLGTQRLRTETAALTAVNFAAFTNMD